MAEIPIARRSCQLPRGGGGVGAGLPGPDAVLSSAGGTHLGLHAEDRLHPGLRPSPAGGLLELRHMVSLSDRRAGGGGLRSEHPPAFTQEPGFLPKASSEILGCFWPLLASPVGEAAAHIRREGVDPLRDR